MTSNSYRFSIALLCTACLAAACSDDKDNDNASGNEGNTPVIVENTSDLCSDNLDNDNNGLKDCTDPGCKDFAFCQDAEADKENTLATCMDKVDNDGDGKTDCDDEECQIFAICQAGTSENTLAACQDGKDNDKDGLIDCQDPECKSFNICGGGGDADFSQTGKESTVAACYFDGIDNDGDTLIDCDDPNCKIYSFCQNLDLKREDTLAACQDGIDNDEDGKADCLDPDCAAFLACHSEIYKENTVELCSDGKDNDEDDQVDCLDPNCWQFAICAPVVGIVENTRELCSDGKDNDFNGKADKDDPNCARFYVGGGKTGENTIASCKDGTDNDGDGLKDCDDPECQIFDFCDKDYNEASDACPDDPYKFKMDSCGCGMTLIDNSACYRNITSAAEFGQLENSSDRFVLKQNIDFGSTTQAPIKGFSGTLDGDNKRITGVFNQTSALGNSGVYYCGLFSDITGKSSENAAIQNLDIAITLNCDNRAHPESSVRVGALAGYSQSATYDNLTGSSKVYLEEAKPGSNKVVNSFEKSIGGLVGYAQSRVKFSNIGMTGNVSAYLDNQRVALKAEGSEVTGSYAIRIGGVSGCGGSFENIQANNYVTLISHHDKDNSWNSSADIGGIVGRAIKDADESFTNTIRNVSNAGVIKFEPINVWTLDTTRYYGFLIGGIAGASYIDIDHAGFSGAIESSLSKYAGATVGYNNLGTNIGGIVGIAYTNTTINSSRVDAEIKAYASNNYIGGIAGQIVNAKMIRNCATKVDLHLGGSTAYGDKTVRYGGIASFAGNVVNIENAIYIVNNSSQTNYKQTIHHIPTNVTVSAKGITNTGGAIVNNFASDKVTCDGACDYTPLAIGGTYVYESYWNRDFSKLAGESNYADASAESYTYNIEGVPVTRANKPVLGMLRYNAGYDGGVLSTHIPKPNNSIQYNDWTTEVDAEGHQVPVPIVQ